MHFFEAIFGIFEVFILICENPKSLFFIVPSIVGLYVYFAYFS